MSLIDELKWRGLFYDMTPGTEELLTKEKVTLYLGVDPTGDSLHVGHLVALSVLKRLQLQGHRPLLVVGGATGMIGDPSGKSEERNLLQTDVLEKNVSALRRQVSHLLDFTDKASGAELLNNYEWLKEISFIDFIRDIGKYISVNAMLSKDSVQRRLEKGLSFTEFCYQLAQGYDFFHLYKEKKCQLQIGGSDQWGNIVTGTELVRKKVGGSVYALTFPLLLKSDGGKFGKTESGAVWLDASKTSPYKFYQFWLQSSDDDAEKYIKIFSFKSQEELSTLISSHKEAPHLRELQKALAYEMTAWVHSKEAVSEAISASQILFGESTQEELSSLSEKSFLDVFEGVPLKEIALSKIEEGISLVDCLSSEGGFLASKSEARREIKQGAIRVNKQKVADEIVINKAHLINGRYLLLQKGKKQFFIIKGI